MSAHVAPSTGRAGRKRYLWALSILWPLTPALFVWLAIATGNGFYYAGTLVFWYMIVPLVDHLFAEDASTSPEDEVQRLEADSYYKWLSYLAVPNHFITLFVSAWAVATQGLNVWEFLALALSVGIVNGLAINTGHELGHKPNRLDNWMAKIVLSVVGYGHFVIEHNRGHHKDVAAPDDPASSRFGENIYKFALREIPGGWTRAWAHEVVRLARRGESTWSLHNEILQPLVMAIILYGARAAAMFTTKPRGPRMRGTPPAQAGTLAGRLAVPGLRGAGETRFRQAGWGPEGFVTPWLASSSNLPVAVSMRSSRAAMKSRRFSPGAMGGKNSSTIVPGGRRNFRLGQNSPEFSAAGTQPTPS